jgi:hypothetical protein
MYASEMILTWIVNMMADSAKNAIRNMLFKLLEVLPAEVYVPLFLLAVVLGIAWVVLVWVCCVYVYHGWSRLSFHARKMLEDFKWSLMQVLVLTGEVLLFVYRTPTHFWEVMGFVQYVVNTSPRVVMRFVRRENLRYSRARDRVLQGARVLSPRGGRRN